jgi:hypothetical protein
MMRRSSAAAAVIPSAAVDLPEGLTPVALSRKPRNTQHAAPGTQHRALSTDTDELIDAFASSEHGADADLAFAVCFLDTAADLKISIASINSDQISRVANRLLREFKDDREELIATLGALWCWFAEQRA